MTRYTVVSFASGILDFLIAYILLRLGIPAYISLAVSIIISGILNYLALERWWSPSPDKSVSSKRLAGSFLAELGTYVVRLIVLGIWRRYLGDFLQIEHLAGLSVSYAVGFVFGYFFRSKIVFVNPK